MPTLATRGKALRLLVYPEVVVFLDSSKVWAVILPGSPQIDNQGGSVITVSPAFRFVHCLIVVLLRRFRSDTAQQSVRSFIHERSVCDSEDLLVQPSLFLVRLTSLVTLIKPTRFVVD